MVRRHTKAGYKSGLEIDTALTLEGEQINFGYENLRVHYLDIPKKHSYRPDFIFKKLDGSYLVVETKGYWEPADRKKHLAIKEQYPELDIRFVFSNSKNKINKKSKTSYADFCNKNKWLYADKTIPKEWLLEVDTSAASVVDDLGLEEVNVVLKQITKMYREGLCT